MSSEFVYLTLVENVNKKREMAHIAAKNVSGESLFMFIINILSDPEVWQH